jgi:formate dehydrogenase accessory protein FdhD
MFREVYTHENGKRRKVSVAVERDLRLVVNGKIVAVIKLSPGLEREFAVGYCLGEGLIRKPASVRRVALEGDTLSIRVDEPFEAHYERYLSSDCITGWRTRIEEEEISVDSDLTVTKEEIWAGMKELQRRSQAWKQTGGVHSVGLVSPGGMQVIEDVSRHIAVDKAIGVAIREGIDLSRSFLLTTGRLPGDMVIKVARVNLPIVASRTAPIHSGVICALRTNLTLVGFVRGGRMNVYTHPWRILED